MSAQSFEEKIRLFCDLNEITHPEIYDVVIPFLHSADLQHCHARNTNDFLIYGLRDLAHGIIDDEVFFQIGDITSDRSLKQARPHLDAVEYMLNNTEPHTLYVIDHAAKVAYEHVHGSWEKVTSQLEKNNAIVVAL